MPPPPPAFRAHGPRVGGGSAEEGAGGADPTHVWRVVQLGNKLEQNFIFSSSEADLGASAPLLSLPRREVTTDVSMKRSRRHRGQTGPGSPFPFGSVLVLAADQSSGRSDGGAWRVDARPPFPGRFCLSDVTRLSLQVPWGVGERPPLSLATSVLSCDEAASTDPPPPHLLPVLL